MRLLASDELVILKRSETKNCFSPCWSTGLVLQDIYNEKTLLIVPAKHWARALTAALTCGCWSHQQSVPAMQHPSGLDCIFNCCKTNCSRVLFAEQQCRQKSSPIEITGDDVLSLPLAWLTLIVRSQMPLLTSQEASGFSFCPSSLKPQVPLSIYERFSFCPSSLKPQVPLSIYERGHVRQTKSG